MIGIPAGSDLAVDVMAESVIEGVLISGTVHGKAQGSCSRCLEPITVPLMVEVQELFQYADREVPTKTKNFRRSRTIIDLEPTIRDAVVLAPPLHQCVRRGLPGIVPECGVVIADNPGHHHDQTDPRWAALSTLFTEETEPATEGREQKGG